MTEDELARLRAACPRALTGRLPQTPHEALRTLADETPSGAAFDVYGRGAQLAAFETRVATELGKEAAVFMPTGTLAQQIALRIWCDRAKNRTVAFHPTCHLEIHEARAYAMLHDFRALLVGAPSQLMTPADVSALADPLGALLIELPQREIGAQLPAWDDLLALCAAGRATGARLHMDGARLWEAAPFYGRSHAEIAAPFDSVYVSFYKGLGALAGAMLAGPADFIAEARVWQHRHGGRPFTIAPFALSAEQGYERNLPKMRSFYEFARALGPKLASIDGVDIVPNPPQTNTFHIFLRGDREALEARAHAFAGEHGTFVFGRLAPTPLPGLQKWEFAVGDATLAHSLDDIAGTVAAVL